MSVAVFEDDGWTRFAPLSLTRHLSQLNWGTKTLLEALAESLPGEGLTLWGREELRQTTTERLRTEYNTKTEGDVLIVNARARPTRALQAILGRRDRYAAFSGDELVAARVKAAMLTPGVVSRTKQLALGKAAKRLEVGSEFLFQGSWDLVESNGMAIAEQAGSGLTSEPLPRETTLKGPHSNLRIHESAEFDGLVSIDSRLGPVVVDEEAVVESLSMLSGPCYVGRKTRIRSALVRSGTSIFENCRVGGEVENSILMSFTNKAHSGYVGDSIVGEWVNLGAGSIFSNLKNTYGSVRVENEGKRIDTGTTKFGPVVGDMAKVSIGALVFAGKTVGVGSHVTGLADRNVPSFTYFEGGTGRMVELLLDSVIETQRRMMERRGGTLSRSGEALVRQLFKETAAERRSARVKKGRLRLTAD